MEARVDDEGRVVLPKEVAERYGLLPGSRINTDEMGSGLHLRRPTTHLAKLYIEPTSGCNLNCRTCVRNAWDEPVGQMAEETFTSIVEGLRTFTPVPAVTFGGFGEPLSHPDIARMVARAKEPGGRVELITNGTLLDVPMSRALIAAGLDMLWLSLDGARPESYSDIRLGGVLGEVVENVTRFGELRSRGHHPVPALGIAFVATQRNIGDLPGLLALGQKLHAARFMVTNVLPHTEEMRAETLFGKTLRRVPSLPSPRLPQLSLPRMDMDERTLRPLGEAMHSDGDIRVENPAPGGGCDRCPFVEQGAGAVGWDGGLAPCLPLLHSHISYLGSRRRFTSRYLVGNVTGGGLRDLWLQQEHVAFRDRVQRFTFSPCSFCGGCELSLANQADCFGNVFPTCGGCLWAQGVIQCP